VTPALLGGLRTTMISMLIATQVEELLNWRMAGALSMMLLIVTLALFMSLNQVLGLDKILSGDASSATARGVKSSDGLCARIWSSFVVSLEVAIMAVDAALRRLWRGVFTVPSARAARKPRAGKGLRGITALILLFLLVPLVIIIPISFTSTLFLSFPPKGFSLRWYAELLDAPIWARAFFLSLRVGLVSAALAMLLGLLAAVAVVRTNFPGKNLIYLFLISPLIVPVIVIAVALYYFFAQLDLVGSFWGLVLGHTIGGIPVVLILVCSALRSVDLRLEYAAMSLGASATRAFVQITLPIILPALLAASFFAFLHSFDEVVIATFIGGLSAETLPKKLWEGVRLEIKPTLAAVSSLLILFTALILLAVEFLRHGRGTSHAK
jgi:putative spermidine/putrescine transport system permease protein